MPLPDANGHAPGIDGNAGRSCGFVRLLHIALMETILSTFKKTLGLSALVMLAAATVPAIARDKARPSDGIRYDQVPKGAWSIVAEVRAQPGKEAELREATLPLVALVRSDPKNLAYFLQEDRAAPGHFIFYEVFATREDFEAHNAMPYVQDWFAKLPALAQGGVQVMRMEVLGQGPR
jgi:quinol monooxygenase YgiN